MDWQTAFNIVLTVLLALIGSGLGYVLTQIRNEFARIDKRIDELRQTQQASAKEARVDHVACQQSLPNIYVTRREYEATTEAIRADIQEIKTCVRDIYEILRNRP